MTLREYFNQDKYFSESAQELVSIDEMPFPHAFNAWKRLYIDFGRKFVESRLNQAFMERLSPSPERIREDLTEHGKSSHIHFGNTTPVRSKFYNAARTMRLKVTTHKESHWVTASLINYAQVRVKGEKVA